MLRQGSVDYLLWGMGKEKFNKLKIDNSFG